MKCKILAKIRSTISLFVAVNVPIIMSLLCFYKPKGMLLATKR